MANQSSTLSKNQSAAAREQQYATRLRVTQNNPSTSQPSRERGQRIGSGKSSMPGKSMGKSFARQLNPLGMAVNMRQQLQEHPEDAVSTIAKTGASFVARKFLMSLLLALTPFIPMACLAILLIFVGILISGAVLGVLR